jgi:hypothetical protein
MARGVSGGVFFVRGPTPAMSVSFANSPEDLEIDNGGSGHVDEFGAEVREGLEK